MGAWYIGNRCRPFGICRFHASFPECRTLSTTTSSAASKDESGAPKEIADSAISLGAPLSSFHHMPLMTNHHQENTQAAEGFHEASFKVYFRGCELWGPRDGAPRLRQAILPGKRRQGAVWTFFLLLVHLVCLAALEALMEITETAGRPYVRHVAVSLSSAFRSKGGKSRKIRVQILSQ